VAFKPRFSAPEGHNGAGRHINVDATLRIRLSDKTSRLHPRDLLELLIAERGRYLRIKAGVPDGAAVDLSLVKLPDDALMFPVPPAAGESFMFTKLRGPENVTKEFQRKAAKLGFGHLRFHDLRGSHETALLDKGVSVHVVAARCGHEPAVLLRNYAKRTKKADTSAAEVIGSLSKGVLGN
jgi:integrase